MSMVSQTIQNLINGISQQPVAIRKPDQCELGENLYSAPFDGCGKRPPTQFIKNEYTFAINTPTDVYGMHGVTLSDGTKALMWIARSATTSLYSVVVSDTSGVIQTVDIPDGLGYLSGGGVGDFKFTTIADTTFLTNTTKVVAVGVGGITTGRSLEALVWIKDSNPPNAPGAIYQITLDGVSASLDDRGYGAGVSWGTTDVATSLAANLITALGGAAANYTITATDSYIYIKRVNGADFTLKSKDSKGDTWMTVIKGQAKLITDLPVKTMNGFMVKITGDESTVQDDYYVRFAPTDAYATVPSPGVWKETIASYIVYTWNLDTLPYTISKVAGVWTFKRGDWAAMTVGDNTTNPYPSMVGKKIKDLFLFKNRLGWIGDQFVCMSRAGSFYDFFKSTTITLLDDAPIDIQVDSSASMILYHATPTDDGCILWAENSQFLLKGGDLLTTKTVTAKKITDFHCSTKTRPVISGRYIYFADDDYSTGFNRVREFFTYSNSTNRDAADVTAHCPRYLRAASGNGVLAVCPAKNLLLFWAVYDAKTTDETQAQFDRSRTYAYQLYWNGDQKLQSSWNKWVFDDGCFASVGERSYTTGGVFIGAVFYRLQVHNTKMDLESITLSEVIPDTQEVYLDRRVTNSQCTGVAYSGGTNSTSWTLPYVPLGTIKVVNSTTYVEYACTVAGSVVTVAGGDYSAQSVYLGQAYTKKYRFSQQFYREQDGAPSLEGRLQYHYWKLSYSQTGYLKVVVTPSSRGPYTYTVPAAALRAGILSVPVLSRSDQITIEVQNDDWRGSKIISAQWTGQYTHNYQKR